MDLSDFEKKLLQSVPLPPTEAGTTDPPDETVLAAYLDGMLTPEQAERVTQRLAESPDLLETAETFVAVRHLSDEGWEAPSRATVRKAIDLFPKKAPDARCPLVEVAVSFASDCIRVLKETADAMRYVAPAYAGVRSTEAADSPNLVCLTKAMDGLEAEVEIERIAQHQGEVTIRTREPGGSLKRGVRVSLYDGERELESQMASSGEVTFSDLNVGDYLFELTQGEEILGQIALHVTGEAQ